MKAEEHIIFRYMLGTIVEMLALAAACTAAILTILNAVGWLIEWTIRNTPDWMIIPEIMLLLVISFVAVFPEMFFIPKKRLIRGYRVTLYPNCKEANIA